MAFPKGIESTRLLLVEGRDEEYFLPVLLSSRNLPCPQVMSYEGKNNLAKFVRTLTKMSNFTGVEAIGVIRDADGSAESAFQSVAGSLVAAGLTAPSGELALSKGSPHTAVLILPGDKKVGEFEDTLMASVKDHKYVEILNEFIAKIEVSDGSAHSERAKAWVRSFMAVQQPSLDLIGVSAKTGLWPLTAPTFDGLAKLVEVISPSV